MYVLKHVWGSCWVASDSAQIRLKASGTATGHDLETSETRQVGLTEHIDLLTLAPI
jgi:hypothetical protein